VAALVAVPLAACGDDDDDDASTTTADPSTASEASGASIALDGAWARTSPAMATAGAVYVEITNDGDVDDALVGVSVDASLAGKAELHETTAADDTMDDDGVGEGSGSTMGDDMGGGMMQMQPVDEIPVPAGETVSLEPGGYHIMLLDLAAPLEVGSTIEVTLSFAEAGEMVLEAEVRDTAP
jgi:copper(I)-binding protein